MKLFLHKEKIKNLYFHLNLLLSLFYSLCSFFFSNISFELTIFCILFFFCTWKMCPNKGLLSYVYFSVQEENFQNSLGHLNHQPHELKQYWYLYLKKRFMRIVVPIKLLCLVVDSQNNFYIGGQVILQTEVFC